MLDDIFEYSNIIFLGITFILFIFIIYLYMRSKPVTTKPIKTLPKSSVLELTETDFTGEDLKGKNTGLIMFMANWCPHCHDMLPVWDQLGNTVLFCDIMKIDCAKYPNFKPSFVKGYPTISLYKNGKMVKMFDKDRHNLEDLMSAAIETCPSKNCKT